MLEVVRGLLAAMPIEVVDQKTNGGTPLGWSALSLVSNARDAANERADIARWLVAKRTDLEVPNAHGATPLIDYRLRRWLLVGRAGPPGRGRRRLRHQRPWPQRLGRHAAGPGEGSLRATEGSHRC